MKCQSITNCPLDDKVKITVKGAHGTYRYCMRHANEFLTANKAIRDKITVKVIGKPEVKAK